MPKGNFSNLEVISWNFWSRSLHPCSFTDYPAKCKAEKRSRLLRDRLISLKGQESQTTTPHCCWLFSISQIILSWEITRII